MIAQEPAGDLPTCMRPDSRVEGPTNGKAQQRSCRSRLCCCCCSSSGRSKLCMACCGVPADVTAALLLLLAADLVGYKVAGGCTPANTMLRFTSGWQQSPSPAAAPAAADWGPTTDVPVMVLPPFAPTCKVRIIGKDTAKFGCPILSCRMDAACTIHEPTCCAYLHYEMLSDFRNFLASKCLENEFLLAHGTALGAVRDSTILPHTQDLDIAVTPFLIQFLELNSTREELWRHGYAVFLGEGSTFWKFHAHIHHPKPEFRNAFKGMDEYYGDWEARTKQAMAVYMDLWPMWRVPEDLTDCEKEKPTEHYQHLAVPWDNTNLWRDGKQIDTCSPKFAPAHRSSGNISTGPVSDTVCSLAQAVPWSLKDGGAPVRIGNTSFRVPANYDAVFKATYGAGGDWRVPNTGYRGTWPVLEQGRALIGALEAKLSVTAWGAMNLTTRVEQCKQYA